MMPPIMESAIGPQKTCGAIGIMPKLAAAAVSRIGRMRCCVASTTAVQRSWPSASISSICAIRMIEFRRKLLNDGRRLRRVADGALDRDGRDTVASPHDRLLQIVAERRKRQQRHHLAVAGWNLQPSQRFNPASLVIAGPADDADEID